MRISTWEPLSSVQSPQPFTQRLNAHQTRPGLHPVDIVAQLDPDVDVVILAHPWRQSWASAPERRQADIVRMRMLADALLDRVEPEAVFIDHPPPSWRSLSGKYRRGQEALQDFREHVLQPLQERGMLAAQYGVQTPREFESKLPVSPVLWSLGGAIGMLELSHQEGHRFTIMPWLRGIGQWSPNGSAPTTRSFLFSLLAAWVSGASHACVWFDPRGNATTAAQRERMAACIDLVAGLTFDVDEPKSPSGPFGELLETLAGWGERDGGGKDWSQLLGILAGWERGPHQDPDTPSEPEDG